LQLLVPGSHHCPLGQFRGCAEPVADSATDTAAIGAAAAAMTIERRMILYMSPVCPESRPSQTAGPAAVVTQVASLAR
jgi:hypothetical protein